MAANYSDKGANDMIEKITQKFTNNLTGQDLITMITMNTYDGSLVLLDKDEKRGEIVKWMNTVEVKSGHHTYLKTFFCTPKGRPIA